MNNEALASQRARMPDDTRKSNSVINVRTLATAHKRLAELLCPGMHVLDVGCGAGAITRGIAEAVGPTGRVVGVDLNTGLIDDARCRHSDLAWLSFEVRDACSLERMDEFDIVTSARVLQWLSNPCAAIENMVTAAKPRGIVVVLDYNHEKVAWAPDPSQGAKSFYESFLRWRSEAGMDNAIADHLVDLFAACGLKNVAQTAQHEVIHRDEPAFAEQIGLWANVAASRGLQMVSDGFITESERALAESGFRRWMEEDAQVQTLYLLAVEGIKS